MADDVGFQQVSSSARPGVLEGFVQNSSHQGYTYPSSTTGAIYHIPDPTHSHQQEWYDQYQSSTQAWYPQEDGYYTASDLVPMYDTSVYHPPHGSYIPMWSSEGQDESPTQDSGCAPFAQAPLVTPIIGGSPTNGPTPLNSPSYLPGLGQVTDISSRDVTLTSKRVSLKRVNSNGLTPSATSPASDHLHSATPSSKENQTRGLKRASSSESEAPPFKKVRQRGRLTDIESPRIRKFIESCFPKIQKKMMFSTPWMNAAEARDYAVAFWKTAICEHIPNEAEHFEPSVIHLDLIAQRPPQFRGDLVSLARALVASKNGSAITFEAAKTPSEIEANRCLVNTLKSRQSLAFKDPISRLGYPYCPLIQPLLNELCFKRATKSVGLTRDFFEDNVIPLTAIALILSAIECAIDGWQTGNLKKCEFKYEKYNPMYESHLRKLNEWVKHCESQDKAHLPREWCQLLFETAKTHALGSSASKEPSAVDGDGETCGEYDEDDFA